MTITKEEARILLLLLPASVSDIQSQKAFLTLLIRFGGTEEAAQAWQDDFENRLEKFIDAP